MSVKKLTYRGYDIEHEQSGLFRVLKDGKEVHSGVDTSEEAPFDWVDKTLRTLRSLRAG